jgi:hypothetical protein
LVPVSAQNIGVSIVSEIRNRITYVSPDLSAAFGANPRLLGVEWILGASALWATGGGVLGEAAPIIIRRRVPTQRV